MFYLPDENCYKSEDGINDNENVLTISGSSLSELL